MAHLISSHQDRSRNCPLLAIEPEFHLEGGKQGKASPSKNTQLPHQKKKKRKRKQGERREEKEREMGECILFGYLDSTHKQHSP